MTRARTCDAWPLPPNGQGSPESRVRLPTLTFLPLIVALLSVLAGVACLTMLAYVIWPAAALGVIGVALLAFGIMVDVPRRRGPS